MRILVFDSGLGGLTVYREIAKARPGDELFYVADDSAFPYGALAEGKLVERVVSVMDDLAPALRPDLIVIACYTASTLVLAPLRARFSSIPFVGTVPAIKPAAAWSRSRLISVLATPGTVARDYTRALVREFAGDCQVQLVGAPNLARLAEDLVRGLPVADAEIVSEIAPCFVARDGRRTDIVALACTHYPLLKEKIAACLPVGSQLISQGEIVADSLADYLQRHPGMEDRISRSGAAPRFYTTDSTEDFDNHAGIFYGKFLRSSHVFL